MCQCDYSTLVIFYLKRLSDETFHLLAGDLINRFVVNGSLFYAQSSPALPRGDLQNPAPGPGQMKKVTGEKIRSRAAKETV
jgi:hypothetical protein